MMSEENENVIPFDLVEFVNDLDAIDDVDLASILEDDSQGKYICELIVCCFLWCMLFFMMYVFQFDSRLNIILRTKYVFADEDTAYRVNFIIDNHTRAPGK